MRGGLSRRRPFLPRESSTVSRQSSNCVQSALVSATSRVALWPAAEEPDGRLLIRGQCERILETADGPGNQS